MKIETSNESNRPNINEEVIVYFYDLDEFDIMKYEETDNHYSFTKDGNHYYPEEWARLEKPNRLNKR